MSIRAVAWVLEESGLRQPELGVLTALAYHADDFGQNAWPSISTLTREAGVSRTTVFKALQRFRDDGVVEITGKGPRGVLVHRLLMGSTGTRGEPVRVANRPSDGPVRDTDSTGTRGVPKPSLTVSSNNPPVVPPEVAALNGRTSEVVERFKLVARERKGKALKVDVPRLLRVLEDHAHLPSLYVESIKCAEWLGSERGRSRTDAPRTLRNWLEGKVKEQPKSPSGDDWRRQWTAFAERKRQEQAAA